MFVVTDFVFVLSPHTHSLVVAAGCVESQEVLELAVVCMCESVWYNMYNCVLGYCDSSEWSIDMSTLNSMTINHHISCVVTNSQFSCVVHYVQAKADYESKLKSAESVSVEMLSTCFLLWYVLVCGVTCV